MDHLKVKLELEARNTRQDIERIFAAVNKQLHDPALSGQQRGILNAKKNKLKNQLAESYRKPGLQLVPAAAAAATRVAASLATEDSATDQLEEPREVSFDFYCIPSSDAARQAAEKAWSEWLSYQSKQWKRMPSAEDLDGYKAILGTTLANLMYATLTGNQSGVYITRYLGVLTRPSRYRPDIFNRKFVTVIDGLMDTGWLAQMKGQRDKNAANPFTRQRYVHSDRTVIRGSKRLRAAMDQQNVKDVSELAMERSGQEIILLKSGETVSAHPGDLVEYQDTPLTISARQKLRTINAMLENANIALLNRDDLRFIDERQRFVQRQFTYGRFDSGGRLKGGFWLNMPKHERFERIRINGESVVELDYKAMLPHLMYAKVGLHVPAGDPYIITGLSPQSREGVKKLFAALTFDQTNNRSQFPKKTGHLFSKTDHARGCSFVIEALLQQHKAISHLFGHGAGHQFQFNESELMIALLLRLREWGFVGLPIHDCLLVPRSQAFDVQNLMEQVALDILKIETSVSRLEGTGGKG